MNPETPEADAVEQAQQDEAIPEEDGPTGTEATWEADPADLADQTAALNVSRSEHPWLDLAYQALGVLRQVAAVVEGLGGVAAFHDGAEVEYGKCGHGRRS